MSWLGSVLAGSELQRRLGGGVGRAGGGPAIGWRLRVAGPGEERWEVCRQSPRSLPRRRTRTGYKVRIPATAMLHRATEKGFRALSQDAQSGERVRKGAGRKRFASLENCEMSRAEAKFSQKHPVWWSGSSHPEINSQLLPETAPLATHS